MSLALQLERAGGYTVVAGTAAAVVWMFTQFAPLTMVTALEEQHENFVTSDQFEEYVVEELYDSFYELLDRFTEATEAGNVDLAKEFSRRLEKLKAKICESDPEWERCRPNADE